MLTIDQLTTVPTIDDIFNQMIAWQVNAGIPADKWKKGGVGRSITYAVAAAYVVLANLVSFIAQAGFLNTASGDFLTLLAFYVYGVQRVVATFASGTVLVSNSSGSVYDFQPGELQFINSTTGKSYRNTAAVHIGSLASNVSVDVEALEQGTDSNAAIGEIDTVDGGLNGLTVTNPSPVLGVDAWTDSTLQAACLAKLGALSMLGPRGAYQYAIQTATLPDGSPVNVNRFSISEASSTGVVTVYLASPSGPVTTQDINAVVANIEAIARPDSVTAIVNNTTTVSYSKTLTVWVRAGKGIDSTTIHDEVVAALEAYASVYDIGGVKKPPSTQGYMYDESIRAVAQAADKAIFAVDSNDGLDLAIGTSQTALITSTVNVRLVVTPVTS